MSKSPDAFRTISEVAEWLGIQAHVLRFWESKFSQVKPIKRAGGRRYYRPNDMLLLGGIKRLLHDDGLTIKGVQKLLREEGMSHVAGLSMPLDELTQIEVEAEVKTASQTPNASDPAPAPEEPAGVVLPFESAPTAPPEDVKVDLEPAEKNDVNSASAEPGPSSVEAAPEPDATPDETTAPAQTEQDAPAEDAKGTDDAPDVEEAIASQEATASLDAQDAPPADTHDNQDAPPAPEPETEQAAPAPAAAAEQPTAEEEAPSEPEPEQLEQPAATSTPLPSFLRKPLTPEEPRETDNPPSEPQTTAEPEEVQAAETPTEEPAQDKPAPAPMPRVIDMPPITPEADLHAVPAALSAAARARKIDPARVAELRPLLAQLSALRDSMASQRKQGADAAGND